MTINAFEWRTLTEAINQIKVPGRFLMDRVFKKQQQVFAQTVDVDLISGNEKLAPFVAPLEGGVVVQKLGMTTNTVKLPRIRMKKNINSLDADLTRAAGQGIYIGAADGINQARREKIALELADLKNKTYRTIEYMCAKALQGELVVTQDNLAFSIDFQIPSGNKINLTGANRWNQTTAKIRANIRAYKKLIAKTGFAADILLLGSAAAEAFLDDEDVRDLLDKRNITAGALNLDGAMMPKNMDFLGRFMGLDVYEYGEEFEQENGSKAAFLSENNIIMLASEAEFVRYNGLILDEPTEPAVAMEFFSKSWNEKDPAATWLLSESDPLPVPRRPGAIVTGAVINAA
ncbi:MAG TPA: major capsid protein [bacterium]|nr:major capsid protein [bacterium]